MSINHSVTKNSQLTVEKEQWTQGNWKNNQLVASEIFNFWISKKKIDGLKALWICRTIYDGHFFVIINTIWENWIDR